MKATEQTQQMLDRAIRKIADKFPASDEAALLTDIHIRVTQETGEQWIDNKDDDFYQQVAAILHKTLERHRNMIENMSILKPYSFVLEDDDKENQGELFVADDDTVIINPELMAGLDEDLDAFLKNLMKD